MCLCLPLIVKEISVDARGEQEVLDEGHDLELAQIVEQLVKLVLVLTVQDQVGAEHEYCRSHEGKNLQRLETQDAINKQEKLVNLEVAHERVENPWESRAKRLNTKLIQVVADLGLIHLQEVFEKLAQRYDRLVA